MHFNKRLASYSYSYTNENEEEIILRFEDGTEAHADVLIGADGIRSPTRRTLLTRLSEALDSKGVGVGVDYKDFVEPVWSGTLVYRSLIPASALEAKYPGHRALSVPVVVSPRHLLFSCTDSDEN